MNPILKYLRQEDMLKAFSELDSKLIHDKYESLIEQLGKERA